MFTAGVDGLVRVFETAKGEMDEPRLLEENKEEVEWLDCSVSRKLPSYLLSLGKCSVV